MRTILLSIILSVLPISVLAQAKTDYYFQARVVEVLEQKEAVLEDGTKTVQQNLKLRALEGDDKGKEVFFYGIGDVDVIGKNLYAENDKVLVISSASDSGEKEYFVTDYVRGDNLILLFCLFAVSLVVVGFWRGLRSLLSLILTFFVVVKYVIPSILGGANPVIVTSIGAIGILVCIIYISEGFNRMANTAILSISASLLITIGLSYLFVMLAKLTGYTGEEMSSLVVGGFGNLNFKGLLLAGIIIGTLGVLDDVVIAQVTAVKEIHEANKDRNKKEIFLSAYRVGSSHITSMTNTLFLAYAGASLPLIALVTSGGSAFSGFDQIINNEEIATEIVRTLAGSIGLVLSVPISTALAVWRLEK